MFQDYKTYQEEIQKNFIEKNQFEESSFDELITNSTPKMVDNIEFNINESDVEFSINTNFGKSLIYYSIAANNVYYILFFLESLITDDFESYFMCDEEGPETFFYTIKQENNKIRFIHISDRKQSNPLIEFEDFKIRQDIIIDKNLFVQKLYNFSKEFALVLQSWCRDFYSPEEYEYFIEELNIFEQMYKR